MRRKAEWLTESEEQVWRSWLRLSADLPAALHRELSSDADLSLQDFDVLVQLSEAPERRLRVSALAAAVHWERSRLSHHLKRMETRGLVDRVECEDDARGTQIAITRAGLRALAQAAPGHVGTVRALFVDVLSERELRALGAINAKLQSRLDAVDADPIQRSE